MPMSKRQRQHPSDHTHTETIETPSASKQTTEKETMTSAMASWLEATTPPSVPFLVATRQATHSQVKGKAPMPITINELEEEEWEVKPEILEKWKKDKEQPKITTLILESFIDDSSSSEKVQHVSPPKRSKRKGCQELLVERPSTYLKIINCIVILILKESTKKDIKLFSILIFTIANVLMLLLWNN